ncbi:winged helix-turn-helix domain-containing protein [Halomicrococcus gelatinilyticus]|uniref:winged helix-turn-helix domain-containing protein n=1 Tax=Halomicrococcus gelatinilyticus TaxID=1702103 RepID=UPI002E123FAE
MDGELNETTLSPDEAFAALGHDIRVQILKTLATADRDDRPMSFSDLRERIGTVDSAKFNYHLDTLVGHFVERTDDGYDLRRAGGRVSEAILSGAVTDDPVLELTRIGEACHHCGRQMALTYRQERVATYCAECGGTFGTSTRQEAENVPEEYGFLGYLRLPPAGMADRTPTEVHEAAHTWSLSERLLAATGTCPRCSATLDEWLTVCEDHQLGDGECDECTNRFAVMHSASCTNCIFDQRVACGSALLDTTELQSFLTAHDVNLVSPEYERFSSVMLNYEETVVETDPLEARLTFSVDGDALSLTVDEELTVLDAERHDAR